MRVLITGAHFTPAVAVIEQLRKFDDVEVTYVGRKTTLEGDKSPSRESQVLPFLGVKFIPIIAGRLQRSFTIYTIPSLLKIPIGLIQAFYIVFSEKPNVILSFGGYVALPLVFIGWLLSIPIIIHEQTLGLGLANKVSFPFADRVAISFQSSAVKGEKVILTGNPIRQEIIKISLPKESRRPPGGRLLPSILVMGGTQGAHLINLAVEEVLEDLTKITQVIHVTGDNKFGDFERLNQRGNFNKKYSVKKWIGDGLGQILSKVDLVISRSGINTLTELAFLGKPVLVIPLPCLYQDEQNKNANFFAKLGLTTILSQKELSGKSLLGKIRLMLKNLTVLKNKAKNGRLIIIPDAASRLALETVLLGQHE